MKGEEEEGCFANGFRGKEGVGRELMSTKAVTRERL